MSEELTWVKALQEHKQKMAELQAENKRLKETIIKPLLEGYCNMAQMINSQEQFMGDQLTQRAHKALQEKPK